MSNTQSRWRKPLIIILALLAIGVWSGARARHTLLAMDIAKMNTSQNWKMASLVLLTPEERQDIKLYTHDKHDSWDKFFTLASGITIQKVIDTQRQLQAQQEPAQ